MRNRRLRKDDTMLRLEEGFGFHRQCGKGEVIVDSPLRSITEADANTSNFKGEEQDLVRSCVTSNIYCKSVILLNLPLDNKSPDVGW